MEPQSRKLVTKEWASGWSMVWFRWGCTASCGWNVRCVGVRGDPWSVMLSPCNTVVCVVQTFQVSCIRYQVMSDFILFYFILSSQTQTTACHSAPLGCHGRSWWGACAETLSCPVSWLPCMREILCRSALSKPQSRGGAPVCMHTLWL